MIGGALTPQGRLLRVDVDAAGLVVGVEGSGADTGDGAPGPRSGHPDGHGDGAWLGADLPAHTAPSGLRALEIWLADAAGVPRLGPLQWHARRTDGFPLVCTLHALGAGRLVVQRAGGPIVGPGIPPPQGAPNTGPDHVLNHDVRGALRNARAFVALYARKLPPEPAAGPAPPVTGQGPNAWADATASPSTDDSTRVRPEADRALLAKTTRTLAIADRTIDGLVRFHRLDTDALSMGPVSLTDLAVRAGRRATEELADLAVTADRPDLGLGLVVHGPGHAGDQTPVTGRDDLLEWVLAELCVNARKFGGPTVVSVTCRAHRGWVRVRVGNTGPPLDRALAEEAFSLGRLLQPRHEQPGVGLGLPLCRRVLARHAGSIGFVADPGRDADTEIEIELPLAGPPTGS